MNLKLTIWDDLWNLGSTMNVGKTLFAQVWNLYYGKMLAAPSVGLAVALGLGLCVGLIS